MRNLKSPSAKISKYYKRGQCRLARRHFHKTQYGNGTCKRFAEKKGEGNLPPEQIACALAEHKCDEVAASRKDSLVIGCDTVVVYGGKILGKPKDAADAENTLKMLSGRSHCVVTGVCVRLGDKKITRFESTEVVFNVLSEEFIKSYVAGGSPMDKAGSYGIQDGGIVKSYSGSYTNVVGLPVELVGEMIEEVRSK